MNLEDKIQQEINEQKIRSALTTGQVQKAEKLFDDVVYEKIEKGVYINDAENRKLGRVGQKYGGEKKEKEFHSKEKLIERLISQGNNPDDVKKMVNKYYDYVKRVYPNSTLKEVAEVIRTIY